MFEHRIGYRNAGLPVAAVLVGSSVLARGELRADPVNKPDPDKIRAAVTRSWNFIGKLAPKIDPVRLRRDHRMKGKKFLVEYLNGCRNLYRVGDEARRTEIREILGPIAQSLNHPEYHNLGFCDNRTFKQDVISYLSACVLLTELGFDTEQYRREVDRIVVRTLSRQHLSGRGIDNTMAIVYRLGQLGHRGGPDVCQLWNRPGCVTREHPDLTASGYGSYRALFKVYRMTHEIFYLTEFGKRPIQCAGPDDLAYIKNMHEVLIPAIIREDNLDILAELAMDLNYLGWTDLPVYAQAVRHILVGQNPDGSWGNARRINEHVKRHFFNNPDYLIDVGQYLHTTEVCINALSFPLIAKSADAKAKTPPP